MDIERRYTSGLVELRKADSGLGVLTGYAAVYNKRSQNLGGFVEVVAPTAFNKSIADGLDVLARYNHDDNYLIGRTSSGTLRVGNDANGLPYEVDLPDTTVGRDLAVLAERGDVTQSSFAFITMDDEWGTTESGFPLRTLTSVKLVDVAPVNTPAYLDTTAGMRSLAKALHTDEETIRKAAELNQLSTLITHELPAVEAREGDEQVPEEAGQGATHPTPLVVRRRQADWLNRR